MSGAYGTCNCHSHGGYYKPGDTSLCGLWHLEPSWVPQCVASWHGPNLKKVLMGREGVGYKRKKGSQ